MQGYQGLFKYPFPYEPHGDSPGEDKIFVSTILHKAVHQAEMGRKSANRTTR